MLREIPQHAAVGGRKLDVNKAQRTFAVLRAAVGLQGHGNGC